MSFVEVSPEYLSALRQEFVDCSVDMTRAFNAARNASGSDLGSDRLLSALGGFEDGWADGQVAMNDSLESAIRMLDVAKENFEFLDTVLADRFDL